MKYILVSFLIGFYCYAALGQTATVPIHGFVADDKGISIPYVSVSVLNAGGTIIKGGMSDANGRFTLNVPAGTYILQASMMSYKPYRHELKVISELDLGKIVLENDATSLSEVKVTGRKKLIDQQTDRMIMNVGSSVLAAGNSAYNILSMAPSLQVSGGSISMQGKSNVLILLNGKKLPGTTLEDLLSSIPGDQIDRIEIITSPSSKYDADASGGVIEIYTKKTDKPGWNGNLSGNVSRGKRSAGGLNTGVNVHSKKIDFNLSGGYSRAGHYETGYDNRVLFSGREAYGTLNQTKDLQIGNRQTGNISGGLNLAIDNHQTIGLSVDWIHATAAVMGGVQTAITGVDTAANSRIGVDNNNKLTFSNYNLFYKNITDTNGSNLIITFNYADYFSSRNQLFSQYDYTGNDIAQSVNNFTPANFDIYTGSADYVKIFSEQTSLEGGIKYNYTKNSSSQQSLLITDGQVSDTSDPMFSNLGYRENITAAYLNLNHKMGNLSLQAGLRGEKSDYDVVNGLDSAYFNLFPNIRFDLTTGADFTSSLGYARNINRPAYENLIPYVVLLDNYTTRVGNPFLRPEYAHTFTFYESFKQYGFSMVYTLTNNTISQMLYYDQNSLKFTKTMDNFRKKHLFLVNLTIPVQVGRWLQSNNRLSGFYQNLQYPDPFSAAALLKRDKSYFNISSYNSFMINKNLSAEASASYMSASMEGIYDYGAYSNITVGVKKDIWNKRAFLKLDVSDIFFDNNRLMTTNAAPLITRSISRNDTRRLRLSFRYNFGGSAVKRKNSNPKGNKDELDRLGL